MIETIYSNESGVADRISKPQTSFRMPKNIRQIGKSNNNKKIYVEDYVMTYIKQLAGADYSGCTAAVLVGQCIKLDNCRNIFISGAVAIKNAEASEETAFTNETWNEIYEEIKKYFVETEIVGWFIGGPGYLLADEDKILKIHVDNFAGQDKVLLTYDNLEKEEAFLSYENNKLVKQDGYYIYYEKNDEMQAYIIDHKKEESNEDNYNDKVSKDIRSVLQNKKPSEEENKNVTRLMYAAGTLLAVIVLIVGAAMLRNYDQMKSMQETLNYLTQNMKEPQDTDAETADKNKNKNSPATVIPSAGASKNKEESSEEEGLDVQVVPGNVEPVKEADSQSGKEDSGKAADSVKENDSEKDNDSGTTSDKDLAGNTAKSSGAAASDTGTKKAGTDVKKPDTGKSAKAASSDKVKYYTVKDGDTLADISYKLYNTYTKVDAIMKLNGITDQNVIFSGQKLKVP